MTIEHIAKSHIRKEEVVARVVAQRGEHIGLVHVISAMEACDSYRPWHDKATGKNFVRRLANYLSFTFTATCALFFMRNIDVVFVESQPISLGIAGYMLRLFRGIPYVYNIPDLQTDSAEQLGFLGARTLLRLAVGMENFFMRKSWTVSTVTHRFIKHFVERGIPEAKITFLPNGADVAALRDALGRQDLPAIVRAAHRIKGASKAVGAWDLTTVSA